MTIITIFNDKKHQEHRKNITVKMLEGKPFLSVTVRGKKETLKLIVRAKVGVNEL